MTTTYTHEIVDGVEVALSPERIAELQARDDADAVPAANRVILAQISALEALQTPRLLREALKKKGCTVNKPGTIIHGMSPEDAVDALDEALDVLRAQLTGTVYYQAPEA